LTSGRSTSGTEKKEKPVISGEHDRKANNKASSDSREIAGRINRTVQGRGQETTKDTITRRDSKREKHRSFKCVVGTFGITEGLL